MKAKTETHQKWKLGLGICNACSKLYSLTGGDWKYLGSFGQGEDHRCVTTSSHTVECVFKPFNGQCPECGVVLTESQKAELEAYAGHVRAAMIESLKKLRADIDSDIAQLGG